MPETTNEDLKIAIQEGTLAFKEHSVEDHAFQNETRGFNGEIAIFKAETEGSLAELHTKIEGLATKEDTAQIVEEVITKLLLRKGKTAYTIILGTGAITVSLIAILGGFKTLLAWIGFNYIR